MPYLANTNPFKTWVFLKMLQQSSCFTLALQHEQQDFWCLANSAPPKSKPQYEKEVMQPFFLQHPVCPEDSSVAGVNLTQLAQLLHLGGLEVQVLALFYHLQAEPILAEFMRNCLPRPVCETGKAQILADILGCKALALQQVLKPDSPLAKLGLIKHRLLHFSATALPSLELDSNLLINLHFPQPDATALLSFAMCKLEQPALPLQQFAHVPFLTELRRVLKAALAAGDRGFAILLHGPAGLGKTALIQSLAHSLKLTLCAVQHQDLQGATLSATARLTHFQLAQHVMAGAGGLILVDECSDILGDERNRLHFMQQPLSKLTINQLLENTPVPTIFVCNSISGVDSAHLSRFSKIYAMPALSVAAKAQLLTAALPKRIRTASPMLITNLASMPGITPRIIRQSVRFLQHAGVAGAQWPQALPKHLQQQLLSQQAEQAQPAALPGWVMPAVSAPDSKTLEAGVRHNDKLLITGPAGSGKYTLARQLLAQQPFTEINATDLFTASAEGLLQRLTQQLALAAREQHALLLKNPSTVLSAFCCEPLGALLNAAFWQRLLSFPALVLVTHTTAPDFTPQPPAQGFYQSIHLLPWPAEKLWQLAEALCHHFNVHSPAARQHTSTLNNLLAQQLAQTPLYPSALVTIAQRAHWLGINTPADLLQQAIEQNAHAKPAQIGFVQC